MRPPAKIDSELQILCFCPQTATSTARSSRNYWTGCSLPLVQVSPSFARTGPVRPVTARWSTVAREEGKRLQTAGSSCQDGTWSHREGAGSRAQTGVAAGHRWIETDGVRRSVSHRPER
jgi:hypothetical protein